MFLTLKLIITFQIMLRQSQQLSPASHPSKTSKKRTVVKKCNNLIVNIIEDNGYIDNNDISIISISVITIDI